MANEAARINAIAYIIPSFLLSLIRLSNFDLFLNAILFTPYYYYNTTLLNQTIDEALRLANKDNIKIHFSLKSNFNEKIVKIFASHKEIGADCVSGGEVKYALKHFPPEKIVFAGIGKTDEEIEHAINNSIFCINVESFEEYDE